MALLLMEADRLREHFNLTRGETDILAAVLGFDDVAPRAAVRSEDGRSFDVLLTRLNRKLPATVAVVPQYPEGQRWRKGETFSNGGSRKAIGYAISNPWAREQLMRVARPKQKGRRAA